jgi:hypothetical protein
VRPLPSPNGWIAVNRKWASKADSAVVGAPASQAPNAAIVSVFPSMAFEVKVSSTS